MFHLYTSVLIDKHVCTSCICSHGSSVHSGDGRNPALVDMVDILLFTWFCTSRVVHEFFHQQYHRIEFPSISIRTYIVLPLHVL